jgi:hypothetical protein
MRNSSGLKGIAPSPSSCLVGLILTIKHEKLEWFEGYCTQSSLLPLLWKKLLTLPLLLIIEVILALLRKVSTVECSYEDVLNCLLTCYLNSSLPPISEAQIHFQAESIFLFGFCSKQILSII